MKSPDPSPDGSVDVQIDDRAQIPFPRQGELQPPVRRIAGNLPVAHRNLSIGPQDLLQAVCAGSQSGSRSSGTKMYSGGT
jgi:hypothetical protein